MNKRIIFLVYALVHAGAYAADEGIPKRIELRESSSAAIASGRAPAEGRNFVEQSAQDLISLQTIGEMIAENYEEKIPTVIARLVVFNEDLEQLFYNYLSLNSANEYVFGKEGVDWGLGNYNTVAFLDNPQLWSRDRDAHPNKIAPVETRDLQKRPIVGEIHYYAAYGHPNNVHYFTDIGSDLELTDGTSHKANSLRKIAMILGKWGEIDNAGQPRYSADQKKQWRKELYAEMAKLVPADSAIYVKALKELEEGEKKREQPAQQAPQQPVQQQPAQAAHYVRHLPAEQPVQPVAQPQVEGERKKVQADVGGLNAQQLSDAITKLYNDNSGKATTQWSADAQEYMNQLITTLKQKNNQVGDLISVFAQEYNKPEYANVRQKAITEIKKAVDVLFKPATEATDEQLREIQRAFSAIGMTRLKNNIMYLVAGRVGARRK